MLAELVRTETIKQTILTPETISSGNLTGTTFDPLLQRILSEGGKHIKFTASINEAGYLLISNQDNRERDSNGIEGGIGFTIHLHDFPVLTSLSNSPINGISTFVSIPTINRLQADQNNIFPDKDGQFQPNLNIDRHVGRFGPESRARAFDSSQAPDVFNPSMYAHFVTSLFIKSFTETTSGLGITSIEPTIIETSSIHHARILEAELSDALPHHIFNGVQIVDYRGLDKLLQIPNQDELPVAITVSRVNRPHTGNYSNLIIDPSITNRNQPTLALQALLRNKSGKDTARVIAPHFLPNPEKFGFQTTLSALELASSNGFAGEFYSSPLNRVRQKRVNVHLPNLINTELSPEPKLTRTKELTGIETPDQLITLAIRLYLQKQEELKQNNIVLTRAVFSTDSRFTGDPSGKTRSLCWLIDNKEFEKTFGIKWQQFSSRLIPADRNKIVSFIAELEAQSDLRAHPEVYEEPANMFDYLKDKILTISKGPGEEERSVNQQREVLTDTIQLIKELTIPLGAPAREGALNTLVLYWNKEGMIPPAYKSYKLLVEAAQISVLNEQFNNATGNNLTLESNIDMSPQAMLMQFEKQVCALLQANIIKSYTEKGYYYIPKKLEAATVLKPFNREFLSLWVASLRKATNSTRFNSRLLDPPKRGQNYLLHLIGESASQAEEDGQLELSEHPMGLSLEHALSFFVSVLKTRGLSKPPKARSDAYKEVFGLSYTAVKTAVERNHNIGMREFNARLQEEMAARSEL